MKARSTTPKLDAQIAQVDLARQAEGLGPLPRVKAIAQITAERLVLEANNSGMVTIPSTVEMWAWIILEPVIEDDS